MENSILLSEADVELATAESARFNDRQSEIFTAVLTARLLTKRGPEAATEIKVEGVRQSRAATEFFAMIKPRRDNDKSLAAAYYLRTFRNQENFTSELLRDCLKEGKIVPPTNVSLTILANARKGYLAEAGPRLGRKIQWCLTDSGWRAVEVMLADRDENRSIPERRV